MTAADWAILMPAVVAVLTALAAYIRAHSVADSVNVNKGKLADADKVHSGLQQQISDLSARVSSLNGPSKPGAPG